MICEICCEKIVKERPKKQFRRAQNLARIEVYKAVRNGTLEKKDKCEVCESADRVQSHHWHGYNKDRWLDVLWLCQQCHTYHERVLRDCGITIYKGQYYYPRKFINI